MALGVERHRADRCPVAGAPAPASRGAFARSLIQGMAATTLTLTVRQAAHRRGKEQTRDHPLPQTLRGRQDLWLPLPANMPTSDSPGSLLTAIGASTPINCHTLNAKKIFDISLNSTPL